MRARESTRKTSTQGPTASQAGTIAKEGLHARPLRVQPLTRALGRCSRRGVSRFVGLDDRALCRQHAAAGGGLGDQWELHRSRAGRNPTRFSGVGERLRCRVGSGDTLVDLDDPNCEDGTTASEAPPVPALGAAGRATVISLLLLASLATLRARRRD
jgi:hypothetical protein